MQMHYKEDSVEQLNRVSLDLFIKKDFEGSLFLSEELAKKGFPDAIFRCGLIIENGWCDGCVDLDRADLFYQRLASEFNHPEGYLGRVRILIKKKDFSSKDLAIKYCLMADAGRSALFSYLLMGRVYEELFGKDFYDQALALYLKSARLGSSAAMRLYSRLLWRRGKYFRAIVAHTVTTIVSPFILIFLGKRASRFG